jgi:hypothetical protein
MQQLTVKPIEQDQLVPSTLTFRAAMPTTGAAPAGEDWLGFALTAVEFGLLVLAIRFLEIESQHFGKLAAWAWAGFVVNHFLPLRWRLPFFVAVSLWCLYVVAGGTVAVCVLAGGLALLAICHLPIPMACRVLLLVALGLVLAWLRVGAIGSRVNVAAWAILGSMFMFRIIVYLYDLAHKNGKFGLFQGMAYFFMLPNVCFLFFPLVDYKTFCSTYFNTTPVQIYQRGVRWILRGIIHLLLYRLLLQFGTGSALEAANLGDVVRFTVVTFLSYLKISGQFHVIVGLLHMFGFHLPQTHHLYYLSSSFTDLWRRMNIYWKDFVTKVVFYPAYFRLKRFGATTALALSTTIVLVATWFLHGYQYFWIRGGLDYTWRNGSLRDELGQGAKAFIQAFNFSRQDSIYWLILTVLMVANVLYESKRGRQRTLTRSHRTVGSEIGLALSTIATFVTMCCLWTFWYSRSFDEVKWLAGAAVEVRLRDIALVLGGLAGLGIIAVLVDRFSPGIASSSKAIAAKPVAYWKSIATVGLPAIVLVFVGIWDVPASLEQSKAGELLATIKEDQQLNPEEADELHRGYYEELDVARRDDKLRFLRTAAPIGWYATSEFQNDSGFFQVKQLRPNYSTNYHGKRLTINRWGTRDRNTYEREKPPGVYRIALFGSSHEFGSGVADHEVFANLVADRLNAEAASSSRRYEIWNFAQPADSTFHYVAKLILKPTVKQFQPDSVFIFVNERETKLVQTHLDSVFRQGTPIPPELDVVAQVLRLAQLDRSMSREMIFARLKKFIPGLFAYAFGRLADFSRETGIAVYIVFRPSVVYWSVGAVEAETQKKNELLDWAAKAGLPTINLSNAFDGIKNRRSLMVTPFDDHMNAEAHRLFADCLFQNLHDRSGKLILDDRSQLESKKP